MLFFLNMSETFAKNSDKSVETLKGFVLGRAEMIFVHPPSSQTNEQKSGTYVAEKTTHCKSRALFLTSAD